eukprot:SAG11_NODE_2359_length_3464_cov_2.039525_1_plen_90_part_00
MATFSDIAGAPGMRWAHALVIGLNASFTLKPAHFGRDLKAEAATEGGDLAYVAWWGYQASATVGEPCYLGRAFLANLGLFPDLASLECP